MNDSYIMGCYGCKYLNGEHCKGAALCLGHANYTTEVDGLRVKEFNIGDRVRVVRDSSDNNRFPKGRVFEINKISKYIGEKIYMNTDISKYIGLFSEDIELIEKEGVKEMEKTFKEVITDIKEGETWECYDKTMWIDSAGRITIQHKGDKETPRMCFDSDTEYTLQRNKVSFTEAFKEYEEGKEIESCVSGFGYKMQQDGKHCYINGESARGFRIEEIKGLWYINA